MKRITTLLVAAAVATAMLSVPVRAEMAQSSTTPSTTEKVKSMTKAQWAKLQAGWKKEKAKYAACNTKAKADKLTGRKRWGAVYDCMTM